MESRVTGYTYPLTQINTTWMVHSEFRISVFSPAPVVRRCSDPSCPRSRRSCASPLDSCTTWKEKTAVKVGERAQRERQRQAEKQNRLGWVDYARHEEDNGGHWVQISLDTKTNHMISTPHHVTSATIKSTINSTFQATNNEPIQTRELQIKLSCEHDIRRPSPVYRIALSPIGRLAVSISISID